MKKISVLITCALALSSALIAQHGEMTISQDAAATAVGTVGHPLPMHSRLLLPADGPTGTPGHPFDVEVRCGQVSLEQGRCKHLGDVFYTYHGHNMRTSAGTNWQYGQMAGTPAAVGTYLALTATTITPAEADTTLAGEISANGLGRANATPTNASTTLSAPSAPTGTVVGATGSTTFFYFVQSCNQGICTLPSAPSASVTTANSTLTTSNYVAVSWVPVPGASSYQLLRNTSSTTPSGTVSALVGGTAGCSANTCTQNDVSNSLGSVTVPASNLTNFGKYTLQFTWTCNTASQSAASYGVFNAGTLGTLIFEGNFTPVSLNVGDTFQLTETVFFALLNFGIPALVLSTLLGLCLLILQRRGYFVR